MGRPPLNRKCAIFGCEAKHLAKGFCRKHYDKQLKADPEYRAYLTELNNRWLRRKQQNGI